MTPLRIAMRERGEWWVAHVAPVGTMDGAIEVARVKLAFVKDGELRAAYLQMIQLLVAGLIAESGVEIIDWQAPVVAPGSERIQ